MKVMNSIAIPLLLVFFIAVAGCNSNRQAGIAPVSGTVTYEGKPVPKILVSLSPLPVGENYVVGPYSNGVTDSEGRFTLETRYGDAGAVVGKHSLGFQYSDISGTAMSDLRNAMGEAKETGSKEGFEKAKKKIAELKAKLKGRPVLLGRYRETIDVPADGLTDLQLELSEFGNRKK